MQNEKDNVTWSADSHTIAKLGILKKYLEAWMPILSNQVAMNSPTGRVVYIDAFAGPGKYAKGENGSPLIAIEAAIHHKQDFPIPIDVYFIEKDEGRCRHLHQLVGRYGDSPRNVRIHTPINGDAEEVVPEILASRPSAHFRPTLVFLDQFGWASVSMELIAKILSDKSCEVFSFMNWRDLNRWLKDETKWPGIDGAFGDQSWREILDATARDRSKRFLELYNSALVNQANVQYFCSFSMHDDKDKLIYWLIFCTKNDEGLMQMKKAMWSIDPSGGFRFSDKHAEQLSLLQGYDQVWLADVLIKELDGKKLDIPGIRHYVLTSTPCYQFKAALKALEIVGDISIVNPPPTRRKGSFPEDDQKPLVIQFNKTPRQGTLFSL